MLDHVSHRLVAIIKQHIAIWNIVPPAPPVSKVVGMHSRIHKATSQLWIRGEGGKQKPENDYVHEFVVRIAFYINMSNPPAAPSILW